MTQLKEQKQKLQRILQMKNGNIGIKLVQEGKLQIKIPSDDEVKI